MNCSQATKSTFKILNFFEKVEKMNFQNSKVKTLGLIILKNSIYCKGKKSFSQKSLRIKKAD